MTKPLLKNSKYNPLTEEEWSRFASLIDLSQVPEADRQKVLDMFKASAEVHPMVRRLCREQTAPFVISLTDDDMYRLESSNAGGDADGVSISWLRDSPEIPSTAFHEMRHMQQMKENMWAQDSSREFSIIANKLQEAEAISISSYVSGERGKYFDRLLLENEAKLEKDFKAGKLKIPYADGLTDREKIQAKKLYIHEQAVQKTMGQYIALLMQENGAPTQQMAASFGLDLTEEDIVEIEDWRSFYKEQSILSAGENHTIQEAGLSADEKKEAEYVRNRMIKQYPALKDLPFFQTGFSVQDALDADIASTAKKNMYTTYHEGTNKVLSERKVENGLYVTRVYRDDEKHSISYEVRENFSGKKEGKEVVYDRTGKPLKENFYKNGELVSAKIYHSDGYVYKEEYNNGALSKVTAYDKQGKVTFVNDFSNEQQGSSEYKVKNSRGDIAQVVEQSDEIGTYRTIKYADGRIKKGHITDEGIPVGEWATRDQKGVVKKAFYSGKSIKDPKTGKQKPQQIKNPLPDLKKKGFVCTPRDKKTKAEFEELKKQGLIDENATLENFYVKEHNGSVEFACLSPNGLLLQTGEYKEDKKEGSLYKVGIWEKYNKYSELTNTEIYNEDGELLQSRTFEASTGRTTALSINNEGVETEYHYDASGKVLKHSVYDQNEGDTVSYEEYYKNRKLYAKQDKHGNTLSFNKSGGLETICNKDMTKSVDFYPEDGVTDPNKLKKKRETTSIYDEQTNSWLTRTTEYRKDGTILSISEMDENGNGRQVFFGPDGKTKTAEGALKDYNKTGEWCYYKGALVRKVQYENDQIVSGGALHVSDFDAQYAMKKVASVKPKEPNSADLNNKLSQVAEPVKDSKTETPRVASLAQRD